MPRTVSKRAGARIHPLDDFLGRIATRAARAPSAAAVAWCLGILVIVAFAGALGYPLVFGDYGALAEARLAAYARSAPTPATAWLADASLGWTRVLAGTDWSWHRALNLALHALSVVMAFAIGRRLLSDVYRGDVHSDWVAFLAAALFALHPVSVYATAYLSARSALLAGFFTLAALWCLSRASGPGAARAAWLVPLACLGAVASSPLALGVPLALFLVARGIAPAPLVGRTRTALVLAAVLVGGWCVWALAVGGAGPAASDLLHALGENAVRWLRGVGYAFVPVTAWMAIDMPEPVPSVPTWAGVLASIALAGLVGLGIAGRRHARFRVPALLVGCIGALGCAVMLYPRAWAGFAVWHAYLALFFACALAAWGLARLGPIAVFAGGVAAVAVVGVLGGVTLQTFSSHLAVWDAAVRAAERSGPRAEHARVYVNRATVHRASGHPIAAIQDYTTALALSPDLPRALRGRAQAYVDDKRYGPALADLQRLLEVEPDQPIIHADIGLALMQAGKFADALKSFNTAARQGVREPRLYLNRGLALFSLGGVGTASRALDDIERALALDPGYALAYFNRALIFEQAARAGVRLRDAASPEIMRLVAAQNIARACQLGHVPACDVERMRAEEKARSMPGGEGPSVLTPEMLRDRGLAVPGP